MECHSWCFLLRLRCLCDAAMWVTLWIVGVPDSRNRTLTRPFNYCQQYASVYWWRLLWHSHSNEKLLAFCAVTIDVLIDIYDNKRKIRKKKNFRNVYTTFKRHPHQWYQWEQESEGGDTHNWCAHKVRSTDVCRKHLRFTIFDAFNSCVQNQLFGNCGRICVPKKNETPCRWLGRSFFFCQHKLSWCHSRYAEPEKKHPILLL